MSDSFPCPKCGRKLPPSGVAEVDGQFIATYQCDECIVKARMFGQLMDLPLTFCVNDGKAFDPADPETRFD
jgi:hypothetical protein